MCIRDSPITTLKGVKNATELANSRECHIRDGVAMVRFQMDLEKALAEGKTLMAVSYTHLDVYKRQDQRALHVAGKGRDQGGGDEDDHQQILELLGKDLGHRLLFALRQLVGACLLYTSRCV